MCEYGKYNEKNLLICEYTKQLCTLCVMGNAQTYQEAKANENKVKEENEI